MITTLGHQLALLIHHAAACIMFTLVPEQKRSQWFGQFSNATKQSRILIISARLHGRKQGPCNRLNNEAVRA